MGFPRHKYRSGSPIPSPGDPPDSGVEPASTALAGGVFTTDPPGELMKCIECYINQHYLNKKINSIYTVVWTWACTHWHAHTNMHIRTQLHGCSYMYVRTHIHTHIQTHQRVHMMYPRGVIYVNTHPDAGTHMCVCQYTSMHTLHAYVCIPVHNGCAQACICTSGHAHIDTRMCMHVYTLLPSYTYTHIHASVLMHARTYTPPLFSFLVYSGQAWAEPPSLDSRPSTLASIAAAQHSGKLLPRESRECFLQSRR